MCRDLISQGDSFFRSGVIAEVNAIASGHIPAAHIASAHGAVVVFEVVAVREGKDGVLRLVLRWSHAAGCEWRKSDERTKGV